MIKINKGDAVRTTHFITRVSMKQNTLKWPAVNYSSIKWEDEKLTFEVKRFFQQQHCIFSVAATGN